MAEPSDLQALENISNEVDNSQVKILISSHCMKAQAFIFDKLKKQTERQKEMCKFISSSNLKLEAEMKFADQEIKSLNIATETIKLGNIELNKEYLLSKERKADIFERIKVGTKKYDDLWSMSKTKYESIPIVQKLIEVKNKNKTVQANINALTNESKYMKNEIKLKKNDLESTDRARVIELAEFLVRERTKMFTKINENNIKIKELLNEVEILNAEENKNTYKAPCDQPLPTEGKQGLDTNIKDAKLEDNWSNMSKNTEKDTLALPKLHLQNNDFDILSIKLDQIKKVDLQNVTSRKRTSSPILSHFEKNPPINNKTEKEDENDVSSYFNMSLDNSANNDDKKVYNKNYSEKKLINILEDIILDKNETYKIIKNLEPTLFQATKCITSENIHNYENNSNVQHEINITPAHDKPQEIEECDEIKLTKTREEDVVDPPSQFVDVSQSSQEKKTVSFNTPIEVETSNLLEEVGDSKETDMIKPQDEMLNNSTASEESYTIIKDKILKKRNLDLSPQFKYSKSTLLHKQHEHKVTSKFFVSENGAGPCNDRNENDYYKNTKQNKILCSNKDTFENEICTMEDDNIIVSSPKGEVKNLEMPVAGILFNHGPYGIPDSLNLSISTTGFEDCEDFPHCIDSSVLLSPKADIPATIQTSNNEVLSQEIPNFLAGFRKTGLSFFGSTTSSDTKPDSGSQPQSGNFNFAFGNEEKKGRGGFFSMFH